MLPEGKCRYIDGQIYPDGNFYVIDTQHIKHNGSELKSALNGINTDISNKVDKIEGKGLSTEDYTTAEKNKLSGIEANANDYVHPTTSGNKHIPSGGSSGKILGWSADGTAAWIDPSGGGGAVETVFVGSTEYAPDANGKVTLPSYPTTLPASDVYAWAKQASKPSYTASEVGAIATTAKGAASGIAELDSSGKVPSSQLPSYVDDVLEYSAKSSFPNTGETGKIYVDTSENKTYRWSGSTYTEISPSLALGETSSTAYRGDRGKTAYDHSQLTSGNPHNVTKSDVGLGNVGNFKAVSTASSQGLSDTEKSNARANIGAGTSSFSGSYNDLSNKPTIPTKTSQLTNDSGYTTNTGTVTGVKVGSTSYSPSSGIVSLPAYPTTLPASDVYSWAKASSKPSYTQDEIGDGSTYKRVSATEKSTWNAKGTYSKPSGGIPKSDLASAVQTSLGKADSALQSFTETDPTVPSWAKASSKPSYTYSEVGAAPASHSHYQLSTIGDYRAVATKPNDYPNLMQFKGLKQNSVIGNPSGDTYSYILGLRGWSDSSGGNSHEFAFNNSGIYTRRGASTSWGNWAKLAMTSDIPTSLPASDVYAWAKASSKPTYTASEVGLGNVGNFKAVSTVASQGLSSTEQANARANIGAGTSSFSGSYNDLSNKPTIPTKTSQLTNDSGYTTNTGTVTGIKLGSSGSSYSPSNGIVTLPAYPSDTNTHRPIKVNGSQILGDNTTAVDFAQGGHVRITSPSTGTVKFNLADWVVYHDIEVSLSSLSWTSYGGSYYSSNIDLGNYISYMLGATVLDYDGITPSTVVPCVGGSTSTVWLWSTTGSFSSSAKLKLRAFGILDYNDG